MERPRNGAPGIQMKDVPTLNLGKNGESSGTLNSHRSNSSKNSRSQPNTRPSDIEFMMLTLMKKRMKRQLKEEWKMRLTSETLI